MLDLLLWFLLVTAHPSQSCEIVTALDAQREIAFRHQSVGRLENIYADETTAANDVALLQRYSDRGLTVTTLNIEREFCDVLGGNQILVRDRLARSVVKFDDGTERTLPAGEWREREITLEFDKRWRIASIDETTSSRQ